MNSPSMPNLKLFLLGAPYLEIDGQVVELQRRKLLALLIYLAVSGEGQRRDTLAALLWPETAQSQARAALSRHLSELRKLIGEGPVNADRDMVALAGELWLDVNDFQQGVADAERTGPASLDRLCQAVELYRGDFLSGFTLPDCPDFDEWQFFQAEGLRQQFASALEKLIALYSERGDPEAAIPHARRWLALDPLHEPAHQTLMRLYAQTGQQAAALRQYQLCVQTLDDELGLSPSEETTALYERIRSGELGRSASVSSPPPSLSPAPPHSLPVQATPFIGREAELAELEILLADGEGRLVTIVGPGGMGKTRLALAFAERQLELGRSASDLQQSKPAPFSSNLPPLSPPAGRGSQASPLAGGIEGGRKPQQPITRFPHGLYFVSLAPLSEADQIVPAIAEALGYTFEAEGQASRSRSEQLLGYLQKRQLLLILDNFEHLLDGVDLVADILGAAPEVHILATSRERLHLHGEQVYPIQGLEFPDWETPEDAAEYTAVQLFIQSARRVQPRFELVAGDLTYLTRICRLVEGMPLGIELAASWVDMLSLADIAVEIQRSLDFLETEARNVPDRQRSMRAVFDSSWGRLSENEQQVFAQFSVFRGGFTREAAQAVTGASLRLLSILASKSLLQYDKTNDRYQIHELLRQYAAEKLETAGQTESARDAHTAYFAEFLQQKEVDLKGRNHPQAFAEIATDFENVRQAWLWAVGRRDYASLERAIEGLYWFLHGAHYTQEGQALFNRSRELLAPADNEAPHPVWGKVLARVLSSGSDRFEEAEQVKAWLEQALAIAEANMDQTEVAFCRWLLGWINLNLEKPEAAMAELEQCLTYYRQVNDRFYLAWTLKVMGMTYGQSSPRQYRQPVDCLQESLTLFQELGISVYPVLINLAQRLEQLGEIERSETYLQMAYEDALAEDDPNHIAGALYFMGGLRFRQGELSRARSRMLDSLSIAEENNLEWRQLMAWHTLGRIAHMEADYEQARHYFTLIQTRKSKIDDFKRAVEIGSGLTVFGLGQYDLARQHLLNGLPPRLGWTPHGLSLAALLLGQARQHEQAASLLALAFQLWHRNPSSVSWRDPLIVRLKEELETTLPPDVFTAAWERGQSLDVETTMAQLVEEATQPGWPEVSRGAREQGRKGESVISPPLPLSPAPRLALRLARSARPGTNLRPGSRTRPTHPLAGRSAVPTGLHSGHWRAGQNHFGRPDRAGAG